LPFLFIRFSLFSCSFCHACGRVGVRLARALGGGGRCGGLRPCPWREPGGAPSRHP
jgi:hypothetical protein